MSMTTAPCGSETRRSNVRTMQYRPTSAELLTALAELLDDVLLPALPPGLQHQARVGANIARILEREVRFAPTGLDRERELVRALTGIDDDAGALVQRLRAEEDEEDEEFERGAWETLVAIARDDIAIAKPGHDSWEGA